MPSDNSHAGKAYTGTKKSAPSLEKGVFLPRSLSGGYPPREVIDEGKTAVRFKTAPYYANQEPTADFEQWEFVAPLDRVNDIAEARNGKREKKYPSAENGKALNESKGWFSWLKR